LGGVGRPSEKTATFLREKISGVGRPSEKTATFLREKIIKLFFLKVLTY